MVVMKNITTFTIGAIMLLSAGLSQASPWNNRHSDHRDRDRDRHHHHQSHRYSHKDRIEYKAQVRLRQLGYYRGPIDGQFGRMSRYSLIRFQRDHRLAPSGRLDVRTIRALRIR